MLCPERFEYLASHLLSLLSVVLVSEKFLSVRSVSLAEYISRLKSVFAYSVFYQVMIFVS